MAQPRPSLTLIVDVDERIDSEELRLEIGRSYTYVAPRSCARTRPKATTRQWRTRCACW